MDINNLTAAQTTLIILITIWALFWKGLALWYSARKKQSIWFIIFLLINTVGILEIFYLFVIAKVKTNKLFG